jgi:hypothetical protein
LYFCPFGVFDLQRLLHPEKDKEIKEKKNEKIIKESIKEIK